MRGYIAFVKKEFLENVRTYKLFILLILFFIFGMMSPLTAKLMPELLKNMDMKGMTITIPDPTATDSYMQFFKNVGQMGLVVLVIIFSGSLTTELTKGTLVNVLAKGLSRQAVILAKFTAAVMVWSVSLLAAFLTTYGYTEYLFKQNNIYHLGYSVFCLWLFGIFLLSVLIFAGTMNKSSYGSLLYTALAVGILFVLNLFPSVQQYNPILLMTDNVKMLTKTYDTTDSYKVVAITVPISVCFVLCSMARFKKSLV